MTVLVAGALVGAALIARPAAQGPVRVLVQTELGDIVLEVDTKSAPNTAANFLKYLDAGHYDGGSFHRTVKMDNQPDSPVKIEVIQAGVSAERTRDGFPPIPIERTSVTGLRHTDGAISMARGQPDSASQPEVALQRLQLASIDAERVAAQQPVRVPAHRQVAMHQL